ncbi:MULTISPECIES: helix-turn-helix domain-containing protein [Gordonibacter]|uniref:Helix-turn-helix transcriptional regulator n=1 Tax=Gordonibacter faecis TaxID=3047475 RepID=A0ABT7DLT9_9ACTN|nr:MULTISPECIES: helix-turn-helix transcriptional regulator [unclassified Gordonibacter]MDJ1650207.1 helix-turn-helix transcriptional regulator [Gordonibacter sp. KGMB12511]HIW75959.1 helix-turn-helix domain-containing protein [Candidatus Gordonibacter avicola]
MAANQQLGMRIKDLREARDWSQRECADFLGVHHVYLADVELGKRNLTLANIEKIAAGFGVTLEELFKGL